MIPGKKIKAFSILEVTIAMLLAGITITIAFTAYSMISRSYRQYDEKNKLISLSMQLNKLLQKDLLEGEMVLQAEEGILVRGKQGSIRYSFHPDFIVRDQYELQVDTFKIRNQDLKCFFEERESVFEGLADKITFTTFTDGKAVSQVFLKQYSSEDLMRAANTNLNSNF